MTKNGHPREYDEEEVRARFLRHVNGLVLDWEREPRAEDSLSKLRGLAFSIMAAIDGVAVDLPKFILAPNPHPEDQSYYSGRGESYYSENYESGVRCDISGELRRVIDRYDPE